MKTLTATVRYDPDRLRRKNDWSDAAEVDHMIDMALQESGIYGTVYVHVDEPAPAPEEYFKGPYRVERIENMIYVFDVDDAIVTHFGKYTQISLNDIEALETEVQHYLDFATWMVGQMNK